MFPTTKIGTSEKFGKLEQPFSRLDLERRTLVNREFPMVLIVMLLTGMPQKFTLFIQVSFPQLI